MAKKRATPKSSRDYPKLLGLLSAIESARQRETFRGGNYPREAAALRQRVLGSREYYLLPEGLKIAVKNALRGKPTQRRLLAASSQTIAGAENILHSAKSKRLKFNQVVLLVLQLPTKRQKTALFSMPFKSDKFKKSAWEKAQEARSQKHIERVRKTLKSAVEKSWKKRKMCQQIAGQLMTVSPKLRSQLLAQLKLPLVDESRVRAIISTKKQEAVARIVKKRENGLVGSGAFGEMHPSVILPKGLYPVYRAYARMLKQRGEEYPPTTTDFFEMLRQMAEKRGVPFDDFIRRISK